MNKLKKILLFFFSLVSLNLYAINPDGPLLIVKNPHNSGMFAVFTSVLGSLDKYEKENYSGIRVELDGLYQDPLVGPNWWNYFFEPINIGVEPAPSYAYINCYHSANEVIGRGFALSRERANYLIKKYVHIKPEINAYVDQFTKEKFKGKYVIGVHYRGTDKYLETPTIPFDSMLREIVSVMVKVPKKKVKIYVATDQVQFLDYLMQFFPKKLIYNEFVRSETELGTHAGNYFYTSNYQKGREALLDCLLLSKCDFLIRTPKSSLSVTSARFNLNQPQEIVRSP